MSDTSLNSIIQYGTDADRIAFTPDPAVGSQVLYFWYVTDDAPNLYIWDGSAWVLVNSSSSGITELTGDVTAGPGSGSQAATIAANVVSNSKFRAGGALTVVGRSVNSGGNVADIAAVAASDSVLREASNVIGFGTIATAGITAKAVTYAKIQDISATARVLGRVTAGAGVTEELTLTQVLDLLGSAAQGDILYRDAAGWAYLAPGTSGQFLKTQGAGANPVWATGGGGTSGFTVVIKPTDQTVLNSTVFVNDSDLTFAVAANKVYYFELSLRLTAAAQAADFKFQWSLPSGASVEWDSIYNGGSINKWDNTSTATVPNALSTTSQTTGSNALGTAYGCRFRGFIVISSTSGTATLQWAQNTADNTSPGNRVKQGSSLAYATH